jgi:hypothetical protein
MKPTHNKRVLFSISLLPWLRDFLAVGDGIFDIVLTATIWAPKSKPQESEWTKCGRQVLIHILVLDRPHFSGFLQ